MIEPGMNGDIGLPVEPRFTTAAGVQRLQLPLIRVIDENDIVPMLPPATATDPKFGPYEHLGPEVILLQGRSAR